MIGITEERIWEIAERIGYTEQEFEEFINKGEQAGYFRFNRRNNEPNLFLPPVSMGGNRC